MREIEFMKLSASGNDFILIDNRGNVVLNPPEFARKICRRRLSVGADGLILLEKANTATIRMLYYNSDGSKAPMCGNGARAIAYFAVQCGFPNSLTIETDAGVISATVKEKQVRIEMPEPGDYRPDIQLAIEGKKTTLFHINTGVPHAVIFVPDIESIDVKMTGRLIRHHKKFAPDGVNVDFVEIRDIHTAAIRTYERGVEDETLACGTGAVASAIVSQRLGKIEFPANILVRKSEEFLITCENNRYFLEGKVTPVYLGKLTQQHFILDNSD